MKDLNIMIDDLVKGSVSQYKSKKYKKDFFRISNGKKFDPYFKKYSKDYIEELASYYESINDFDKSQLLLMIKI